MAVTSLFKWPSFVDHVMLKIKIACGWAWICMTWRVSHSLFTWCTIYVDDDEEGAWRRCWWWWQCCCRVHCLYSFKTIFDLKGTPFISRTLKNGTLLTYLSRRISRWTEEVFLSFIIFNRLRLTGTLLQNCPAQVGITQPQVTCRHLVLSCFSISLEMDWLRHLH